MKKIKSETGKVVKLVETPTRYLIKFPDGTEKWSAQIGYETVSSLGDAGGKMNLLNLRNKAKNSLLKKIKKYDNKLILICEEQETLEFDSYHCNTYDSDIVTYYWNYTVAAYKPIVE